MENKKDIMALRHSAAHLLAHAIHELYPDTLLTIGPATQEGFFYDCMPVRNFKEDDLPKIEARMLEIANRDIPLTHKQISKEEARKIYKDNPFKLELINEIPGDTVGLAEQGNFYDLCKGGHVSSTGLLKNFKLTGISGSYWRADRSKQALQRISGIIFFTAQELQDYLKLKEEAAKYDHRKLGKQLDLFSFHDEGVGFPFFHPKGKILFDLLVNLTRKRQQKLNYQEISTPLLLSDELWKRSGHYNFYKDNMYFCKVDNQNYALRPMNCPGAYLFYHERPRSYRELPLRIAEYGLVFRHELSGVLHGLLRARSFTQNDAHLVCTIEQMEDIILETISLIMEVLNLFNFSEIKIGLATKPEKAMGSDELWQKAINALASALNKSGTIYEIWQGDGAFYGPKIDFNIKDSMGREWTCSTIQVDFFAPENFDLNYIASSGKKERPVIIHRAITGSIERFMAILLEHYKGHLPFWLAPVQARILTITDEQKNYAKDLLTRFKTNHLRVELDESSDQISAKIKRAQEEKIPWMLVIGKKEMDTNTVTLRQSNGKQEFGLAIEKILEKARELEF